MLTICLLACLLASYCSAKNPPNVIFIIVDDLGFNDVGYHGQTTIRTPTIDNMAANSIRLENYYVNPICTPSRTTLLSGRYTIHTGFQHLVVWPCQAAGLPLEMPTLAEKLREAGYSTHMVGKWHLGHAMEAMTPLRRGFDTFYGLYNGAENHFTHHGCYLRPMVWSGYNMTSTPTQHWYCGYDIRDQERTAWETITEGAYSTHLFTQKAIEVIKNNKRTDTDDSTDAEEEQPKQKPLFMYLAYQAVHSPQQVPAEYVAPYGSISDYNRQMHAAMVAAVDEGIANVTRALSENGFDKNTLIVFTTDNGGETVNGGNNWPLRGMKISNWEGGVRGAGFVYTKRRSLIPRTGITYNGLVHISDWFPTLVNLAGGNTDGLNLDGVDIWDSISKGRESPRKEVLHNIDTLWPLAGQIRPNSPFDNRLQAAIRVGKWKLLTGDPYNGAWIAPPENTNLATVPDPPRNGKNIWLFDISKDPLEKNDLSDRYPAVVDELLAKLAKYQETDVPPNYPVDDPQCDPQLHGGVWGPWLPDPTTA